MTPPRAGLEVVERLIGIDMSNVVLDCDVSGNGTESELHEWIGGLQHTDTDRTLFALL